MLAFTFIIPAFASPITEGERVHVEGTVQSVDLAAGSFTVLAEDGTQVTVVSPEGFDLSTLIVGSNVEVKGAIAPDGNLAASEIELEDGAEFEVEEPDDEDAGEIEDAEDTEDQDEDENEIEDQDEQEQDDEDSGSFQSGDHEESDGGWDD